RQPVMWAPSVSKSIPFDVSSTPSGTILVGYARGAAAANQPEDEAVGVEIDPTSGAATERFTSKAEAKIGRVTPLAGGTAQFAVTTEQDVYVPASTPFVLSFEKSGISFADRPGGDKTLLFPLSGDKPPDAPRVQVVAGIGYALTYRQGRGIWGAWLTL